MFGFLKNLLGPIFAKDTVEAGRQTRTFVLRTLLASALLLFFILIYLDDLGGNRGRRPSEIARRAAMIAEAVLVIQFVAAFVVAPAAVCGALAGERERGTLDLLFTTQLKSREIVAGKAGARLTMAAITMLIPLPCLAILGTMGGVSIDMAVGFTLATLGALMVCGGVALHCSSRSATPLRAALMTYVVLALLLAGLPALHLFLDAVAAGWRRFRGPTDLWLMHAYVNPIGSAFAAGNPFAKRDFVRALGEGFQWRALLGQFGVLMLFGTLAAFGLRKPVVQGKPNFLWRWPAAVGRWWWRAVRRRVRRVLGLEPRTDVEVPGQWRRNPQQACCGLLEVRNPLWLRGRQAPVYDRERAVVAFRRLLLLFYFCSFGLLLTFLAFGHMGKGDLAEWLAATIGIGWLGTLLPIVLASALSALGDRRRGFLDHVLTTTLEPREVFDGAVLAVLESLRGLLLWALAPLAFGVFTTLLHPGYAALAAATYLTGVAVIVVGVVALSFAARGFAGAVGMGAFFALSLLAGGWAFFGEIVEQELRLFGDSWQGCMVGLAAAGAMIVARLLRRWRSFTQASVFSIALLAAVFCLSCLPFASQREYTALASPAAWTITGLVSAAEGRINGPHRGSPYLGWGWTAHFVALCSVAWLMRQRVLTNFPTVVRRSE